MESRQRKWQKAKQKQGLCTVCGKYPIAKKSKWYCEVCLAKRRVKAKQRQHEQTAEGYVHQDPESLLRVIENG